MSEHDDFLDDYIAFKLCCEDDDDDSSDGCYIFVGHKQFLSVRFS